MKRRNPKSIEGAIRNVVRPFRISQGDLPDDQGIMTYRIAGGTITPANKPIYSPDQVKKKIIDSFTIDTSALRDLAESSTPEKRGLAVMIASNLNRPNIDSTSMLRLVAALSLIELSDGNDALMAVARKLASAGLGHK
jgi:hypothetical protein